MSDLTEFRRVRVRHPRKRGGLTAEICEQSAIDYARNLLLGFAARRRGSKFGLCDTDDEIIDAALSACLPGVKVSQRGGRFEVRTRMFTALKRSKVAAATATSPGDPVGANLNLLAELVGLSDLERELLGFLVVHRMVNSLEVITDSLGPVSLLGAADAIASAIARPRDEVMRALRSDGRLPASGLLRVEGDSAALEHKVMLSSRLVDLMMEPGLDQAKLLDRLLPTAPPPTLGRDDFAHLEAEVDLAARLLASAVAGRQKGINVLFYGATGSGKTELARLLARGAGASLHVAGVDGSEGNSPSADERLSSLLLGNRLLCSAPSLLLFDELEDVFEGGMLGRLLGGGGHESALVSKQWFNLLLESNPVPTVWISNDVSCVDPAFLRRFSYAIEFRPLGVAQRRRIWRHHLGPATPLGTADVEQLAERFTVSAGQIATAVGTARLVGSGEPDRATLERVVRPLEKLVSGRDPSPGRGIASTAYLFEAANASLDLRALAERLSVWQPGERGGLSLCFYGPPGTGKTEFVHHMARRMGRRVVERRVSDIQDKWVGETEKNIAAAFQEAERDGAVLLFDEADSFLRDRRGAYHSWEASQVNEFLQQLEAYRGVVACTTNLWRDLDQASLRRFVFKIELRFVTAVQASLLYKTLLVPLLATPPSEGTLTAVDRELARLSNLTPGDFAAVSRRVMALHGLAAPLDGLALVEELRAEVAAKEATGRAIGF